MADKKTASGLWAPRVGAAGYDVTPETPAVWVLGPYLVREARLEGSTLALTGDLNDTSTIDVFAVHGSSGPIEWVRCN